MGKQAIPKERKPKEDSKAILKVKEKMKKAEEKKDKAENGAFGKSGLKFKFGTEKRPDMALKTSGPGDQPPGFY